MTIETTSIKSVASGNGATTVWPYSFLIPAASDLTVTLVLKSSGDETIIAPAAYTATGLGDEAGGTVTYPLSGSPLSSAYYLVIERALPLTQETDLLNQGGAYPQAIEEALDYLTMLSQQLQDQLNRAIIFSVADTVEVTLPTATARASKFLGFNSSGDPVALDGLTAGTTVSAAMIPVVTAPTTAAALTALGLPGALLDLLIPAGTIWDYAGGSAAPTGFVFPFGQACTATYPILRAALVALGSPFGTSGADPLFPDCRSRSLVGKSNMGGVDNGLWSGGTVLGAVAGAQTVTLALANIPTGITSANTGAIALSASTATSDWVRTPGGANVSVTTTGGSFGSTNSLVLALITVTGTIAIGNAAVTSNNTGGGSHENRMPGLILNKIIKAH